MVYTFNLDGKIVVITGGYGHLGIAITESLLFHGATVYVLGRSREKFNSASNSLEVNTSKLHFLEADISESESIKNSFQKVFNNEKQIDVLINNAVYSKGQSPTELSDEDWSIGMDGVLKSVFRGIREIIPFFTRQKSGKIINVSSMYGMVAPQFDLYDNFPAYLNPPHYGAGKAAVIQLTKYYASWLGKNGIQVNSVSPGPFPSDNVKESVGFIKELEKKTCLNRTGNPEDLAGVFVFLASDASNFITGQNIVVDGGWTCK